MGKPNVFYCYPGADLELVDKLQERMREFLAGRPYDFDKYGPLRVPILTECDDTVRPDSPAITSVPHYHTYELKREGWYQGRHEYPSQRIECDGLIISASYMDNNGVFWPIPHLIGAPALSRRLPKELLFNTVAPSDAVALDLYVDGELYIKVNVVPHERVKITVPSSYGNIVDFGCVWHYASRSRTFNRPAS